MRAIFGGEEDGWEFNSRQQDVDIFVKQVAPLNYMKGIGVIDAPAALVSSVFTDYECRPVWDELYASGGEKVKLDAFTSISYSSFKAPWPVSPRDFSLIGRWRDLVPSSAPDASPFDKPNKFGDGGGVLIYSCSVEHPSCPLVKQHVRGTILFAAIYIRSSLNNPNQCTVVYALASNPNGSLPKSVVNQASIKQPLCVAAVRNLIRTRPDIVRRLQNKSVAKSAENDEKKSTARSSIQNTQTKAVIATASNATPQNNQTQNSPYDRVLSSAFDGAVHAIFGGEEDGWEFNSRQKDVDIFVKTVSPLNYMKGIGVIDASFDVISAVFSDKKFRNHWDELFERGDDLEKIDALTTVSYSSFKAPWPVYPRDFVTVGRVRAVKASNDPSAHPLDKPNQFGDGDGIFIYSCSTQHKKSPNDKKFVRGTLSFAGLYIRSSTTNPNRCTVVYTLASNPNGSIPKGLVNQASIKQPLCVAAVRDLIKKRPDIIKEIIKTQNDNNKNSVGASSFSTEHSTVSSPPTKMDSSSSASSSLSAPPPPSEFDGLLGTCIDNVIQAVFGGEEDGWKLNSRQQDVDIFTKHIAPFNYMKGIGVIDAPPALIAAVCTDLECRPIWDEMYAAGGEKLKVDSLTKITYSSLKAPWPVSPRDFSVIGRWRDIIPSSAPDASPLDKPNKFGDGAGVLVYSCSVEHPSCPPTKNHVRGTILFLGYYIRASLSNPNRCTVVYVAASNPNGSLPTSVVQQASIKQPLCIAKVRDLIRNQPDVVRRVQEKRAAATAKPGETDQNKNQKNGIDDEAPYSGVTLFRWNRDLHARLSSFIEIPEANHWQTFRSAFHHFTSLAKQNLQTGKWTPNEGEGEFVQVGAICIRLLRLESPSLSNLTNNTASRSAPSLLVRLSIIRPDDSEAAGQEYMINKIPRGIMRAGTCQVKLSSDQQLQISGSFPIFHPDSKVQLQVLRAGAHKSEDLLLFQIQIPVSNFCAPPGEGWRGWYESDDREHSVCLECYYQYSVIADLGYEFQPQNHPPRNSPAVVKKYQPVLQTSPPIPATAYYSSNYSPIILVNNLYRLIDAVSPALKLTRHIWSLLIWERPLQSFIALVLFALFCCFPSFLPLFLSIFTIWLMAVEYSNVYIEEQNHRNDIIRRQNRRASAKELYHYLNEQEKTLSSNSKTIVGIIQSKVSYGADIFESLLGMITWKDKLSSRTFMIWLLITALLSSMGLHRFLSFYLGLTVLVVTVWPSHFTFVLYFIWHTTELVRRASIYYSAKRIKSYKP